MVSKELNYFDFTFLEESQVITNEDRNLRSKVESISRSLENLQQKKSRIDYEIRRQKKSLIRKREELKKVSKRNSARLKTISESQILNEGNLPMYDTLQREDSRLLGYSNQVLEQLDS